RSRFDETRLPQPQRVEADRVLDVVFAPSSIRDFLERLERIVIARSKSCIDNSPRGLLWLGDTKVGSLDDRAQEALGRNWIFANVVAVSRYHAAEVLRPRTIDGAVEDYMADIAGTQFLRLGRKP